MPIRTFSMYSLSDLGITSSNYNFATLATGGTFTASATAAPTSVTVNDTDSQDNIYNDGAPGNFGAAPTQQLLSGTVDGTTFTNEPSNPENEFEVTDSSGNVVGFIYDLHDANSSAFSSLQGYVSTFELVPGETYTVVRTSSLVQANYTTFLTCFTRDTRITTKAGDVKIQDLQIGDQILTRDDGYLPLGWIGSRTITARPNQFPIEFAKGAIGNKTVLRVSPQHRVLVTGWRAELLFGESEILVPAKALINDTDIRPIDVVGVTYYHIMFDKHALVQSEGCWTESMLYSQHSVAGLSPDQRAEIEELFPELVTSEFEGCAPFLRVREAMTLD